MSTQCTRGANGRTKSPRDSRPSIKRRLQKGLERLLRRKKHPSREQAATNEVIVGNNQELYTFLSADNIYETIPEETREKEDAQYQNLSALKQARAKVLYTYQAENEHELDLEVGQIIIMLEEAEDDWWIGKLGDKQGLFPISYVEVIEGEIPTTECSLEDGGVSAQKQARAKVIFDHEADEDNELDLEVGQIITVFEVVGEGWWFGELGHKRGLFPSNYVMVIEGEVPNTEYGLKDGGQSAALKQARAIVIFDYHKDDDGELDLEVGQIITVLHEVHYGCWFGKLGDKRGVFPSHCVEVIEEEVPTTECSLEDGGVSALKQARAIVIFDYHTDDDDELDLEVGQIITVFQEVGEDWWIGVLGDKWGLLRSNYVKVIEGEFPTTECSLEDGEVSDDGSELACAVSEGEENTGRGVEDMPPDLENNNDTEDPTPLPNEPTAMGLINNANPDTERHPGPSVPRRKPDLPAKVPQVHTRTQVTDGMLFKISEEVACGERWKEFGYFLDFEHCAIECINADYELAKEKAFMLLVRWKEKHGREATVEWLAETLRKAKRTDVAQKLERLSKEEWLNQRHVECGREKQELQQRFTYEELTELEAKIKNMEIELKELRNKQQRVEEDLRCSAQPVPAAEKGALDDAGYTLLNPPLKPEPGIQHVRKIKPEDQHSAPDRLDRSQNEYVVF